MFGGSGVVKDHLFNTKEHKNMREENFSRGEMPLDDQVDDQDLLLESRKKYDGLTAKTVLDALTAYNRTRQSQLSIVEELGKRDGTKDFPDSRDWRILDVMQVEYIAICGALDRFLADPSGIDPELLARIQEERRRLSF